MDAATKISPRTQPDRDGWRDMLLALVDAAAPALEAAAAGEEAAGRLSAQTLAFLRSPDLLRLKLPAELGGAEGDNALQFEIYEAIAYSNAAASWCAFIYTDIIALLTSMLPQDGLDTLLADGLPLVCGGGGRLIGDARPVESGYRVSGRFAYGSGLPGSDWTAVMAMDKSTEGAPMLMCTVPTSAVDSLDNWDAFGMAATASGDFSVDDVFVPESMAIVLGAPPLRGGPQFTLGTPGLIGHTVPAVALGVARRVLDDLAAMAKGKQRGYTTRMTIGDRPAFQAFLGKADMRVRSARAMMIDNGLRLSEQAATGEGTLEIEAEVRAAGTYSTEVAVEVITEALRWAGGEAIRKGSRFERALRDINVASTHYCIANTSYESHGQYLMGREDVAIEA